MRELQVTLVCQSAGERTTAKRIVENRTERSMAELDAILGHGRNKRLEEALALAFDT